MLIPRVLPDLLLSLADRRVFRPVWQQSILGEVERNYPKVAVHHRGADRDEVVKEVTRLLDSMARAFLDASVATDKWVSPVGEMACDEKDRHVLAVAADVTYVVTENTKDFPHTSVPAGIKVIKIDTFLCELLSTDSEAVIDFVQAVCDRYSQPAMTVAELATKFAHGHSAPRFGRLLHDATNTPS